MSDDLLARFPVDSLVYYKTTKFQGTVKAVHSIIGLVLVDWGSKKSWEPPTHLTPAAERSPASFAREANHV